MYLLFASPLLLFFMTAFCDDDYILKMGCGVGCICHNDTNMKCVGEHWTTIPPVKNYTTLLIRAANMPHLRRGDFMGKDVGQLTTLNIMNSEINRIGWDALKDVTKLKHFVIRSCGLTMLPARLLPHGIRTVRNVDLRKNKLEVIPMQFICSLSNSIALQLQLGCNPYKKVSFNSKLPCLQDVKLNLSLSNTHRNKTYRAMRILTQEMFMGLKHSIVKILELKMCSIEKIHSNALRSFKFLEHLDLSWNYLTTINGEVLLWFKHLKKLNLLQNHFHNLPLSNIPPGSLTHFYFGQEGFAIDPTFFKGLQNFSSIEYLKLETMRISSLSKESLSFVSKHENFTHLEINDCKFTDLQPGLFDNTSLEHLSLVQNHGINLTNTLSSRTLAQKLKYLNIEENSLYVMELPQNTSIFNELTYLNARGCHLFQFPFSVLNVMPNLQNVVLGRNLLAIPPEKRYEKAYSSIKTVALSSTSSIRSAPTNLLCLFPNAIKIDLSRHGLEKLKKEWFDCSHGKPLLVEDINFSSNLITKVQSLENLKHLQRYSLAENRIVVLKSYAFSNMFELKSLNLSANMIVFLKNDTFISQQNLTSLYLANNQLELLKYEVFQYLENLMVLDISMNRLQTVYVALLQPMRSLRLLNMKHNPLECNCETRSTYHYLYKHKITLLHIAKMYSLRCYDSRLNEWIDVLNFQVNDYKCDRYDKVITIASCAMSCYLMMLVSAVLYRWRWYIRYQYFIFQSKVKRQREKELDATFRFAAFVSFSSYDCEWVMDKLVPQIEDRHDLSLCLYNRNWFAGRNIIDYIVTSIDQSRRVLFIVSNHSATSPWCCDEMSLARYRLLSERRDALVLVILERIHPSNMSPLLRHLMTSRVYIQWPRFDKRKQRAFWNSLAKSLSDGHGKSKEDLGFSLRRN